MQMRLTPAEWFMLDAAVFAQQRSGRKQIFPMMYRSIHLNPTKWMLLLLLFSAHCTRNTAEEQTRNRFFKQTPGRTIVEMSLFKVSVSSNVIVDTLNVAIVVTLIRVV